LIFPVSLEFLQNNSQNRANCWQYYKNDCNSFSYHFDKNITKMLTIDYFDKNSMKNKIDKEYR